MRGVVKGGKKAINPSVPGKTALGQPKPNIASPAKLCSVKIRSGLILWQQCWEAAVGFDYLGALGWQCHQSWSSTNTRIGRNIEQHGKISPNGIKGDFVLFDGKVWLGISSEESAQ